MTDHIHIDGSRGEGGGQIVRSAVGLAMVTGRQVTVDRIRAGRPKPGLRSQHLTAVRAAGEICGAKVGGASIGSQSLTFVPRLVQPGGYDFRVETAGSATLVLQTVLPALLVAGGPSTLVLEGGTHNPWAPPFDFLQQTFLPLVNRMGPRVNVDLERHGFFPAGGGRFTVQIQPSSTLAGFDLLDRGEIKSRKVRVLLSNLPSHIAERERKATAAQMDWDAHCCLIEEIPSSGPGNVVMIELASEHVTEIFTSFGRQGIRAEQVANQAVKQARDYLNSDVPVGQYLADQLLLPLGLSAWFGIDEERHSDRQRGGSFRTVPLTEHSRTHIEILKQFLDVGIEVDPSPANDSSTVRIFPRVRETTPAGMH